MVKNLSPNFFKRSFSLLLQRQTNIISAAYVIMATILLSQVLGILRQRLLVSVFGASNILGVYLASATFPDLLFQVIVAAALSSAFIPVFSDYLAKGNESEGQKMAGNLLFFGLLIFSVCSIVLFIFAPLFLTLINLGGGYSGQQMETMANLMRVIVIAQLLFIIGTFFSALLQSYNHFFIPGIAAALYNLGIIIGIVTLSSQVGIFAPAYGMVLGAILFILAQLPVVKKVGFRPQLWFKTIHPGVFVIFRLMWPRTLSIGMFQLGGLAIVSLISFLADPGRNKVIFDFAQTLSFAPVVLFGQAIAQAAFPVLAREREKMDQFKLTFITSFTQLLYLVLPFSVLLLILRIPVVRLIYGAGLFDWPATVLTGRTLAFFSLSVFAQALIYLVSRGFYALHDTKTPLLVGSITTFLMISLGALFVLHYGYGVESIAIAYSVGNIANLLILMMLFDKRTGGFQKNILVPSVLKIFIASFFMGFALYIPIKLLDQLVFDTTRTINLLILTGISSFAGLSLYLFLTWLFNVKEAMTFVLLFRKIGNWREILGKSQEVIEGTRLNP